MPPARRDSPPCGADHVVLVGMMGAGKSTVGAQLAERLGRPLFDSDAMIEARTGQTVAQIFASLGEPAFRAEESAVLIEAMASESPAVVIAAGGAVLDADNRELMRNSGGLVVWLRAGPDVLVERVAGGTHRPLLDDDPSGTLRRLSAQRSELYEEIAGLVVDVDEISPSQVVDQIVGTMARRTEAPGAPRPARRP